MDGEAPSLTGTYRATAVMTVGTLLSRATGLLRVAMMAYALGIAGTRLADTYNLANTTPNIVYELFLGGIFTSVFVPVLVGIRSSKSSDPSPLVSVSLVALAAVSAMTAVAAPLVVKIYTFRLADPELRRQQEELATYLLRWFSPQIVFLGGAAIAQALLNTRRRFGPPAFAPVLNNLVVSATFGAFAVVFGERGLALSAGARVLLGAGTTAGVLLQFVVLVPLLREDRLRFRPRFRDPSVRATVRMGVFAIGYVIVNQLGLWLVLALANSVRGGITSYQLAFMFFLLPHSLFAVSLVTALLPDLAAAGGGSDYSAYRTALWTGLRGIVYLLLPAALGYLILAGPVTRLVLAHGAAGIGDADRVASVLRGFAVGLPFFSVFQLLTRSFYSLRDTRTPLVVNAAATVVWAGSSIPLFGALGVRGLAVGHAASYVFGSALLGLSLSRRIRGLGATEQIVPLGKIVAASTAMAAVVWTIESRLGAGDPVTVAVCVGAGAILYLAFSQVIGIPERRILTSFNRRWTAR